TCFVEVSFCCGSCSRPLAFSNACASNPIPASVMTVSTSALQSLSGADCRFIHSPPNGLRFVNHGFGDALLLHRLQGHERQIPETNTHRTRFNENHVDTSLRNVEADF